MGTSEELNSSTDKISAFITYFEGITDKAQKFGLRGIEIKDEFTIVEWLSRVSKKEEIGVDDTGILMSYLAIVKRYGIISQKRHALEAGISTRDHKYYERMGSLVSTEQEANGDLRLFMVLLYQLVRRYVCHHHCGECLHDLISSLVMNFGLRLRQP